MRDALTELRDDATAALETDDAARAASPRTIDDDRDAWLDAVFAGYFGEREPSPVFGTAVDTLASGRVWPDAPAGKAATSARSAGVTGILTLRQLFETGRVRHSELEQIVATRLKRTPQAIDLLLDRPAATLLHEDPVSVAALAIDVEVPVDRVLQAVVASARTTAGSAYGYTPGVSGGETEVPGDQRESARTVAWGARFLTATRVDTR